MQHRLQKVRENLKLSQKALSSKLDISLRSWQSYESGQTDPPSRVIRKLCELGFSGHWLIMGTGPERVVDSRIPHSDQSDTGYGSGSELSPQDILLLGGRGTQGSLWQTMVALYRLRDDHPDGVGLEELVHSMEADTEAVSEPDLIGNLRLLELSELVEVEKTDRIRYKLRDGALLQSQAMVDMLQAVREAVTTLSGKVAPALKLRNRSGWLSNISVRVSEVDAKRMISEIRSSIHSIRDKYVESSGREVVIVVGTALNVSMNGSDSES